MIRVVIDTNVFISALLFKGPANKVANIWRRGKVTILVSHPILQEYLRVLNYSKFQLTTEEVKVVIEEGILPYAEVVQLKKPVVIIEDDLSDNIFLSTALEGRAQLIVSGDKHLLCLETFRGIKIVTIKEFLYIIQA